LARELTGTCTLAAGRSSPEAACPKWPAPYIWRLTRGSPGRANPNAWKGIVWSEFRLRKELAAAAAKQGCELLDAPVTGTKPHAASGELSFLIGGSDAALAIAQPVLAVLGREFIHLGPTGSGALMKLINNFMCGVQAASLAEAEYMIGAGGLDLAKALPILTHGAPGSGLVQRAAARAFANDFTPNFPLHLMAKDLGYAIAEASHLGHNLQTATSALTIFKEAIAKGYGDQDFSAVIKAQQRG